MARILLVEDERDLAKLWIEVLEMSDHQVAHAPSLAAAKELLDGGFDAAVVDWNLPDAKGDDVVRAIRGSQPDLRIVVTSGADVQLPTDLRGHVAMVLRKPFGLRQLRNAIQGS